MIYKTITGGYPGGFTLSSKYAGVYITKTATVGGTGVTIVATGYANNYGHIAATGETSSGIYLNNGGKVNNNGSGYISGYVGVKSSADIGVGGSVTNYGSIVGEAAGVQLLSGGIVQNGLYSQISTGFGSGIEISGGAGTVGNRGTIYGHYGTGVSIVTGVVRNGAYGAESALIGAAYGVVASGAATVINYGQISNVDSYSGEKGVVLMAGGSVSNGTALHPDALIRDTFGVIAHGGTVSNFGAIQSEYLNPGNGFAEGVGVTLYDGANLTNGSLKDRGASIEGYAGVRAIGATSTVSNFGEIFSEGPAAAAVYLQGGNLTNGAAADTGVEVYGYRAVVVAAAGTVTNFGVILSVKATQDTYALGDYGVLFNAGGKLTNGSAGSHVALIQGYGGVEIQTAAGSVVNFGTIRSIGAEGPSAVALRKGGTVINGAATDQAALIQGAYTAVVGATSVQNFGTITCDAPNSSAVYTNGVANVVNGSGGDLKALIVGAGGIEIVGGSVINYATVTGLSGNGVLAEGASSITNGGGTDRSALIEGSEGIGVTSGAATVKNFGTVVGTGGNYTYGVVLLDGGTLTNGSVSNNTALVEGYGGVNLQNAAAATNFTTISGLGDAGGSGARLDRGASLANGSAGHAGAIVEGYVGVYAVSNSTLTNFGTIEGFGGTAVRLGAATDVLNVEAGSTFLGAIYGGGGTLDLASGVGTISNFGTAALTVTGSMAATTFQNFDTVEVGAGATFTDAAALTIAAAQTVNAAGTLTLGGAKATVTNAGLIETTAAGLLSIKGALKNTGTITADGGTLTVVGAVTGSGVGKISGGTLDLAGAFTQNVTFTGTTGVLELAQSQGYSGDIFGFSKTGKTSLDLLDITFGKSTTATFSGTTAGGILTVTDGTHTAKINLKGNYTTSTFTPSSDGHGGTTVVDPTAKAQALVTTHQFIAAAAGLNGGAGTGIHSSDPGPTHPAMLLAPRSAIQ